MINLQINKTVKSRVPITVFQKILKIVEKKIKKTKGPFDVSVAFVSALAIKKLNKQYRKKDKVTDVLSFLYENDRFGEIIICFQQAQKQAKQKMCSVQKELTTLFVHGLLHLFGYDHLDEKSAEKMEKLEAEILKNI